MKSIVTNDILDQVWEESHKRVMELTELKEELPKLSKMIDEIKSQYIICLNAITVRDYNKIEEARIKINVLEEELKTAKQTLEEDEKRNQKAKQIKEEMSKNTNKKESEVVSNGK